MISFFLTTEHFRPERRAKISASTSFNRANCKNLTFDAFLSSYWDMCVIKYINRQSFIWSNMLILFLSYSIPVSSLCWQKFNHVVNRNLINSEIAYLQSRPTCVSSWRDRHKKAHSDLSYVWTKTIHISPPSPSPLYQIAKIERCRNSRSKNLTYTSVLGRIKSLWNVHWV